MSSTETPTDKPVTDTKAVNKVNEAANKKAAKAGKRKTTSSKGYMAVFLQLILLLAVSAAGYYYWLQLQLNLDKLNSSNLIQSASITELSQQLSDASQMMQQQQDQLLAANELLAEQQSQLKALHDTQQTLIKTSQNNYDISHRSQAQWVLAEVSYLLSLANQRLIVSGDIRTTIIALKSANGRLQELSDPGLLQVRKKISAEIYQLKRLKVPDITNIAFSLDNMSQAIQDLPFKSLQQQLLDKPASVETVQLSDIHDDSLFAVFWSRIKSLVTIKKHIQLANTAVTTLDQHQILSRLRSALENSRAAVINQNTIVFQLEINKALEVLTLYFDQNDNRVNAYIKELTALNQLSLLPELPDITGSWQLLQKVVALKEANSRLAQPKKINNRGKSQQ